MSHYWCSLQATKFINVHLLQCEMDSMEPDVKFVGVKLEPGVKVRFPTEDEDNSMWTIHITQFALAHPAKPGKNVITLINEEEDFVLGTLEANRCEQFQVLLPSRMLWTERLQLLQLHFFTCTYMEVQRHGCSFFLLSGACSKDGSFSTAAPRLIYCEENSSYILSLP